MSNRASVTQAEVRRAIEGAEKAGKTVHAVNIKPGEVFIILAPIDEPNTTNDNPGPKQWPGA